MINWNNVKDGLLPKLSTFTEKVSVLGSDMLKYAEDNLLNENDKNEKSKSLSSATNLEINIPSKDISKSLNNLSVNSDNEKHETHEKHEVHENITPTVEKLEIINGSNDHKELETIEKSTVTTEIISTNVTESGKSHETDQNKIINIPSKPTVLEHSTTDCAINSCAVNGSDCHPVFEALTKAENCLNMCEMYIKQKDANSELTAPSLSNLLKNESDCANYLKMDCNLLINSISEMEQKYYNICLHNKKMKFIIFSWQKYSQSESLKNVHLTKNHENALKHISGQEIEFKKLQSQYNEIAAQSQSYKSKNLELENGLKILNGKYIQVQTEISNLNQSLIEKQKELSKKDKTVEELKLSISTKNTDLERLSNEIIEYKAKISEHKNIPDNSTDLKRLQIHLVEVEDTYSAQILSLEDTKTKLELQLQNLSCDLNRNKANLLEARKNFDRQLSILNEQLLKANKDVETLTSQVVSLSSITENQSKSIMSLQTSLNDTQKENESQIVLIHDDHKNEIIEMKAKYENLMSEKIKERESQLNSEYSLKLQEITDKLNFYKNQVDELCKQLKPDIPSKEEEPIKTSTPNDSLSMEESNNIDHVLLRNLILAYLRIDPQHKNYVLRVIAQIVGISQEELESVINTPSPGRLQSTLSWIPGIGGYLYPTKDEGKESLSELFLNFLEDESQKALSQNPYIPPVSKKDLNDILSRHEPKKTVD